jgi:hypothetical protein
VTHAETDARVERDRQDSANCKRKDTGPIEQNRRGEENSLRSRERIRHMNEKNERSRRNAAERIELRRQDKICLRIRRTKSMGQMLSPMSKVEKQNNIDSHRTPAVRFDDERTKVGLASMGLYQEELAKAHSMHGRWIDGKLYPVFQQDRFFEYTQKKYEAPANDDEADDTGMLEVEDYCS